MTELSLTDDCAFDELLAEDFGSEDMGSESDTTSMMPTTASISTKAIDSLIHSDLFISPFKAAFGVLPAL